MRNRGTESPAHSPRLHRFENAPANGTNHRHLPSRTPTRTHSTAARMQKLRFQVLDARFQAKQTASSVQPQVAST